MYCFSEDKTLGCFLYLSYFGFLFPFVKKISRRTLLHLKTQEMFFFSLNLLVENIFHFPSSCDQNLIFTSQVLPLSNLNRHKEILEAVTLADVFEKHSLEQTPCKLVVGEGRVKLNFKLFGRGTVIMFCMH